MIRLLSGYLFKIVLIAINTIAPPKKCVHIYSRHSVDPFCTNDLNRGVSYRSSKVSLFYIIKTFLTEHKYI